MSPYADLLVWVQIELWNFFIVFLRVAPIMALIPGFSEQSVPMRVRLGLAVAMTLICAPAVIPQLNISPWQIHTFLATLASESILGLALAFGLRFFIIALQTAGAMAAQATSLSQIAGSTVEPLPAISHLLVIGGIALAMMMDLHVHAARYVIHSYSILPVGRFPASQDLALWGVTGVSHSFSLAFSLAAPFVITSVIYNMTLGVINRAMPQLMVAFVGAPVITFGGLALLFLLTPAMLIVWHDALFSFMAAPFGDLR